jgi:hypothetical protein
LAPLSQTLTLWQSTRGGGSQIGGGGLPAFVSLQTTAHWKLTVAVAAVDGVPVPTLLIDAFSFQIGSAGFNAVTSAFPSAGSLTALSISNPDGVYTSTGTPMSSFDLYWSHLWISDLFTSQPLELITIKIDYHLVYPTNVASGLTSKRALASRSPSYSATSSSFTRTSTSAPSAAVPSASDQTLVVVLASLASVLAVGLVAACVVIAIRRRRNKAAMANQEKDFDKLESADL